ncbi:F-box domain-containing protein [Mycena sanguinolenta]|uniref:F-box domain-containing protein n=1 Tax=Mycena sanguinolenta TaxID=230812 RepID=A0A8H7CSR9_9AGAR|nr:F-box domain-containing protein [Mycena sanguinolenta]
MASRLPCSQIPPRLRSSAIFCALTSYPKTRRPFKATISATPAELERYDAEILRQPNELDRLTLERRTLAWYADGCRSVFSPIRRLPVEILAVIFGMCELRERHEYSEVWSQRPEVQQLAEEEVDRVSLRHLRQLAQVSSFWNCVIMETAKLWSTIIVDTSVWSECAVSVDTLLSMLDSSLNRGGDHALTIQVGVVNSHHRPVCELLSRHASRWRDVYFWSDIEASEYLAAAKGNLGRLEKLHIASGWEDVDAFKDAPLLADLSFYGHLYRVPNIPWSQIRKLTYWANGLFDASNCLEFLSLAPNLVDAVFTVDLQMVLSDHRWKARSSNVRSISFEMIIHDPLVVGQMLDSLTFPRAESFAFTPCLGAPPPLWPSQQFVTLTHRSQFSMHLTRLEIHALLTDEELLYCLAPLLKLEELVISDGALSDIVITDTLLQGLVCDNTASGCTSMIPRLRLLSLNSFLGFTDEVYLDLVVSRVRSIHSGGVDQFKPTCSTFETHLWWPLVRNREVSLEIATLWPRSLTYNLPAAHTDTLPPELIHAIVAEIHDTTSLKMCSLVAGIFLESCQRILFRSLMIAKDGDHVESLVLWSRLQQSPHLGLYFESLVCTLPSLNAPHAELNALCAVLDRLTNIRQCVLVGDAIQADRCQWHSLPSQLSAAILKFIQRPQLSQLHIFSIASLPGDVLAMCLAARTLSLVEVSVDTMTAADAVAPFSAAVENLSISCCPGAGGIVDILRSPQYSSNVAKIRNLWVEDRVGSKLIWTLAENLQHIRIDTDTDTGSLADFVSIPPQLSCLRSFEVALSFHERDDPSFVPILTSLAEAASATLQEICVTYAPMYGLQFNPSLVPQTMAGVEIAIVGCVGSPRIRWRLDPLRNPETFFDTFSASLVEGMPRLHKEGRLIVEKYSFDDESLFSWVERFAR